MSKNSKFIEAVPSDDVDDNEDDEEEDEIRINETNFKFSDFSKRLPHPKIVKACSLALRNFTSNSTHTNHCIIKLLHRIAFDCKMYVMVFQLSIFRTFQMIFEAKDLPEYKELVKFATYIVRQFVKVTETNKKVFMEALFWKSSKECYDIEHGYLDNHGKQAAQRAWSELEEDELRRLFMEHRQSGNEEDVVDWVTANLIDQTKSRRQVLKKLKEMMLLVDYKGRKKSGISRAPKQWSEDEEANLQELFEQFKESDDPLGNIVENLNVSRPKNRVVEKLLVTGLIQDKKELRKKRSKQGRKSEHRGSDGDSSLGEDNDESIPRPSTKKIAKPRSKKKDTVKKPKKQKRPVAVPKAKVAQMLIKLMEKEEEMREPLEWLKESFGDAIEDYEADNNEGIPLVPVMDYAETAMENVEFQDLLKALGVCPPFDEQETYWRIPVSLTPEVLQGYSDMIQQAIDKTLEIESQPASTNSRPTVESSDDEDIFNKLKSMAKSTDSMDHETIENVPVSSINSPSRTVESSDDEDVFNKLKSMARTTNEMDDETVDNAPVKSISSQSKTIESSDDEDVFNKLKSMAKYTNEISHEIVDDAPVNSTSSQSKTTESSDDEDEDVFNKLKSMAKSTDEIRSMDDETTENVPVNSNSSPSRTIESSDDEDIFDKLRPNISSSSESETENQYKSNSNERENPIDIQFSITEFNASDTEDTDKAAAVELGKETDGVNTSRKKSRRMLDSDSEDETPATKRGKIIESDED